MCHQLSENWYNISNRYSNSEDTARVELWVASQTCLQEQEEEEAYLPHAGVVGG